MTEEQNVSDESSPSEPQITTEVSASVKSMGRAPAAVKRKPSESARLRAAAVRALKLDAIANRRATAAKMGKAEFIAEIVKGRFKPITAEEIAAEPTPAKDVPAKDVPAKDVPAKDAQ